MSDIFEKLQKLALEEFGCELVRTGKHSSFEELFGFSCQDLITADDIVDFNITEIVSYVSGNPQVFVEDNAAFDVDSLPQAALAA